MALPLTDLLAARVRTAMTAALGPAGRGADPLIRPSGHADFQADGILPLAKTLGTAPRDLAARVAAELPADDFLAAVEVAGPGFLNLTLTDGALADQVAARFGDPRLGVAPGGEGRVTVIDYSQPNIAKEMHVGHLRSTVIGDALVRLLEFDGRTVVRQNHLGVPRVDASVPLEPAERRLVLHLDDFGATLAAVAETFEPHRLAGYLYALAQAVSQFWETVPVLKAATSEARGNRLALMALTGDRFHLGLELLGIAVPDRL